MEKEADNGRSGRNMPEIMERSIGELLTGIEMQLAAIRGMVESVSGVEKVYTTAEVANVFGVKPITIRRWVRAGKLSPVPGHSRFIFLASDVNLLIQK